MHQYEKFKEDLESSEDIGAPTTVPSGPTVTPKLLQDGLKMPHKVILTFFT